VGLHSIEKRPLGAFDRSSNLLPAPSGLTFRFRRACNSLLGLENDLFRLETQVSTTPERNSGRAGSPCCCSGSSVRSCYGSLTGNSQPRYSNCRHGSPGSSPLGSFTHNRCSTACRNRQLFTPRLFANAVSAVSRTCSSNSVISPSRSARSKTRTRQHQRRLVRQADVRCVIVERPATNVNPYGLVKMCGFAKIGFVFCGRGSQMTKRREHLFCGNSTS